MRYFRFAALIAAAAVGLFSTFSVRAQQRETLVWAPVPTTPAAWTAPNKPHWKLSELLATHKSEATWKETVVSDSLLHADYIQPATETVRRG